MSQTDTPPTTGVLPEFVAPAANDTDRTFSLYVHVPFCVSRCGYCDFNTYISPDLGPGASHESYADTAIKELEFAADALEQSGVDAKPLHSVFYGGGTPTLLAAQDLNRILQRARELFGIEPGAEITTEANPDSLSAEAVQILAEGGFNRISMGMQSSVSHVLQVLERTHNPDNVHAAAAWIRDANLDLSLDLIFGTPGESITDWHQSLDAVLAVRPDHVSAYGLIVEEGTKLAAQIRRGVYPNTDPDDQADKYLATEERLTTAGYRWYEISNWAYDPQEQGIHQSQHNLAYWRDQDWWGIGPGAHSHVAGVRWWNAKHPAAYASRVLDNISPAIGREIPDDEARLLEKIMLGVRLSEGLELSVLTAQSESEAQEALAETRRLADQGLIQTAALEDGRIVPTLKGRLLDDAITRQLAGF
ncbi:radical SAM family heme chaperone HemW [Enteractinococcus helveticum]|uniref:Heme chaperone HemW n=1 Tax=Enteractinococcus helveticum TaxID=1837282 RepID=A0A1B7LZK3_9MICC|nr:radical SAM family heme chaperone HemW [Enteractinococcus helveticum]OAV60933.1 coproporphyrinogen III oxidase [Enteractinococcus helveticum]